jgi:hypothetical protein
MEKRFWARLIKDYIIQQMMVEAGTEDKFQYSGKARVLKKFIAGQDDRKLNQMEVINSICDNIYIRIYCQNMDCHIYLSK